MLNAMPRGSIICPVCKCSLQRLALMQGVKVGIRDILANAPSAVIGDQRYFFCCPECRSRFLENPEIYVRDYRNYVVCPVCLAERIKDQARKILYQELEIYLCGCPHCETTFLKYPQRFIEYL